MEELNSGLNKGKKEDLNSKGSWFKKRKSIMASDRQIVYTFLGLLISFMIGKIISADNTLILIITLIGGFLAYYYASHY